MTDTVRPDSLVTLHYRFLLEDGTAVVSTFEATPATLQLGTGEVLPALERCLAGLRVGERRVFTLPPEVAFGPHRPELVVRVARADFPPEVTDAMTLLEFAAPDGSRYAGLVRELTEEYGVVDFNHPLAGKTVRLEVHIIGIS